MPGLPYHSCSGRRRGQRRAWLENEEEEEEEEEKDEEEGRTHTTLLLPACSLIKMLATTTGTARRTHQLQRETTKTIEAKEKKRGLGSKWGWTEKEHTSWFSSFFLSFFLSFFFSPYYPKRVEEQVSGMRTPS